EVTADAVRAAMAEGQAIKLVARAEVSSGGANITVGHERGPRSSLIGGGRGASNVLVLRTDVMGEIAIVGNDPGIDQTAYALLSDIIAVHDALVRKGKHSVP